MSLDHATDLVKQQTLTRDAFLGGRLTVAQPERGFRAGLDSVLLGAAVDLTAPGRVRAAAGLAADHFDSVIANPPFFDPARGSAPAQSRAGARHMGEAKLDTWAKVAATHAAPDGEVIFIHTAEALPPLLIAFTQRFGAVTVLPLLPREGQPASRVLVRGIKGSRAPFRLLAGRALHESDGRAFRPEFDAIFRGTGRLVW